MIELATTDVFLTSMFSFFSQNGRLVPAQCEKCGIEYISTKEPVGLCQSCGGQGTVITESLFKNVLKVVGCRP